MRKPLCQSLDILQSEEKAYYGILLPTVLVCAKKLTDMQEIGDLAVCKPLLSAVLDGLKKRFQPCVESKDCLLSAAFHPHFELSWIPLLPLLGYEDVLGVRINPFVPGVLYVGRLLNLGLLFVYYIFEYS